MEHEIVTTMEQWTTLKGEWDALLARSRASSVFMTWAWLDTWLSIRAPRPSIFVICVRDAGGQLIGVAPYYASEYVLVKTIPYRALISMSLYCLVAASNLYSTPQIPVNRIPWSSRID